MPARSRPPRAVSSTATSTVRVAQHHPGGHRAGHVARHGALAVDVDAVGVRQADVVAGQLLDVRQHARGGGLAVGAGDRGDRDPARACPAGTACRSPGRRRRAAVPSLGAMCMRKPGAALISQMRAADVLVGLGDVGA